MLDCGVVDLVGYYRKEDATKETEEEEVREEEEEEDEEKEAREDDEENEKDDDDGNGNGEDEKEGEEDEDAPAKGKGDDKDDADEEYDAEEQSERVLVKGYMRPDGTSYYVVIPKEIRERFELKGGEYFLIKPNTKKGKITLKLAKFLEE